MKAFLKLLPILLFFEPTVHAATYWLDQSCTTGRNAQNVRAAVQDAISKFFSPRRPDACVAGHLHVRRYWRLLTDNQIWQNVAASALIARQTHTKAVYIKPYSKATGTIKPIET